MADTIPEVLNLLKRIDILFKEYELRHEFPLKNFYGLKLAVSDETPITIVNKLHECIGRGSKNISALIKEAHKEKDIFTKEGAGLEEIKRVCRYYDMALVKIVAMKDNNDCEYTQLFKTIKFRVVKVVKEADKLYTELAIARTQLNSVKINDELNKMIHTFIAAHMAQFPPGRVGTAPLPGVGGRRKTRRIKRRRYTRK
jgi:hypothetical protein